MEWKDEIVGLWPLPILSDEIADEAMLSRLAQLCSDQAAGDEQPFFANQDEAIQRVHAMIAGAVAAYFDHLGADPTPAWHVRARFERLQFGESRGLRNRPGAYLSGIVYLQPPGEPEALHMRNDTFPGCLTLLDPRAGFNMLSLDNDPYQNQSLVIKPRSGLFLMWPANVNHYRHPNLSRTPQLSIGFDIVPADSGEAVTPPESRWAGKIDDIWPTGLIKRRLPDYEQRNRELIDIIDEMERENPNLTTDFNSHRLLDYRHPAIDWLMSHINQSVRAYFMQMGIRQSVPCEIAAWANINRFGDYHSPHNHPWSYLSGTYYIQIPEADIDQDFDEDVHPASISFYDPRSAMSADLFPPGSPAHPVHTITPVPGAMMMWPSATFHFVHPNLSKRKRYTLSFNIHLKGQNSRL